MRYTEAKSKNPLYSDLCTLWFMHCYNDMLPFNEKERDEFIQAMERMLQQGALKGIEKVLLWPNAKIQINYYDDIKTETYITGALYIGSTNASAKIMSYELDICSGLSVYQLPKSHPLDVDSNIKLVKQLYEANVIPESQLFDEVFNKEKTQDVLGCLGNKTCFAMFYKTVKPNSGLDEEYERFLIISSYLRNESEAVNWWINGLIEHRRTNSSNNNATADNDLKLTAVEESKVYQTLKRKSSENRNHMAYKILKCLQSQNIKGEEETKQRIEPMIELSWNSITKTDTKTYYYSYCYNMHDKIGNGVVLGLPNETPHLILLRDFKGGQIGNSLNHWCIPMTITMKNRVVDMSVPNKTMLYYKRMAFPNSERFLQWTMTSFQTKMQIDSREHYNALTNNRANLEESNLIPLAGVVSSPLFSEISYQELMECQRGKNEKTYYFPVDHPFYTNVYLPSIVELMSRYTRVLKNEELFRESTEMPRFMIISKEIMDHSVIQKKCREEFDLL